MKCRGSYPASLGSRHETATPQYIRVRASCTYLSSHQHGGTDAVTISPHIPHPHSESAAILHKGNVDTRYRRHSTGTPQLPRRARQHRYRRRWVLAAYPTASATAAVAIYSSVNAIPIDSACHNGGKLPKQVSQRKRAAGRAPTPGGDSL